MTETSSEQLRRTLLHGLFWNGSFQLFSVVVQFAAMLVLVRLVAPAEYGRVAAVVGLLHLLNAFGCGTFMAEALQRPEGEEPDWTLHWHCGLWIQGSLAIGCAGLAAGAALVPVYAEMSPLLGAAAFGLLIDTPSRLRAVQLQRALDYRRLRLAAALSTALSLVTSITLAGFGLGALALVVGGNVVTSIGYTADLLLFARWRPSGPWVRWPDWAAYRGALRFGLYQSGAGVLRSARGLLASLMLPATLGYESLGLLGRAEALFNSTIQRVGTLLGDTVYPLLPRCVSDPDRFRRASGAYVQATALVLLLGGAFVLVEGPTLSRLLYGSRWAAADPFIAPQTVAGALCGVSALGYRISLARGRLTACLRLDAVMALLGAAAVMVTVMWPDAESFAWSLAFVAAATTLATCVVAASDVRFVAHLLPPGIAAAAGIAPLVAFAPNLSSQEAAQHLAASGAVFSLTAGSCLRLFFPSYLASILAIIPGGRRLSRALLLAEAPPVGAPPT